jgi:murein DD-endopeptidase MepM/ murein hydrolase activator NlpD
MATGIAAAPASAAVPHVVVPGETLWGIAAANNFTTRTVAAFNGLSEDSQVIAGQTIEIPTVAEGASALASAGLVGSSSSTPSTTTTTTTSTGFDPSVIVSAPGMAHVPSPWGELHLAPVAADAWNAMRAESLRLYGTDLYPNGPLSAYRTYEQQGYLYDLFLSGQGAAANPPGTSSHESGYAVDVATPDMRWVIDQIGAQFCWGKVHAPGEWWHVDYIC